jgi:hypothetical protein
MNLMSQLTPSGTESRDLTIDERAELACRLAKQLERVGEYEAASEALSEFWPERVGSANVEGLRRVCEGGGSPSRWRIGRLAW